jgi:hypothetical protein
MNVVGYHDIVEHRNTKAFLGLENPAQIRVPVSHSGDVEVETS